ncbi:hypothetical protein [Nannocystis bainbridge]|uniref:Uncharacterized protein n=1 Tax=Nannocystis bainbridge TaxID=2995303 RepID=A0ABT5E459_9BACT|nr:hypothetical protein [Nannocystis bainbridge]MDC0720657.1 hypothetical protein [Nannocystis bainbridge]
MLLRLVLVSTMLVPPPSEAEAVAAFNEGKLELALKLHRERAAAPGVHAPTALYGVHDSLRALYRTTGDVAHLCEALDVARGLVARGGFATPKEEAAWVELEATDASLVDKADAECPASAPAEPTPEPAPTTEPPTTEPSTTEPTPTTGPRAEGPGPQPGAKDSMPEPGAKDRPPWRPRGRVIAASVLGGIGLGLLGGMAGALVRREQAEAELGAIVDAARGREYTAAERAAAHGANDRYVRLDATWPALLTVACVSLITSAAVLFAPTRAGSRARARAGGAGFVYSF